MELTKRAEKIASESGITFFGTANLTRACDFVLGQGGQLVAGFPFSISIGLVLPGTIVDDLPNRSDRAVALSYKLHAYDVINQRLDSVASRISLFMQNEGFPALPIPASLTVNNKRLCGLFSHKLGAHLAGLGWIGKSCLLITPSDGPRVRWATILTNAPLVFKEKKLDRGCGNCHKCVDICPVKAFSGKSFKETDPREARYNAKRCYDYFNTMESAGKPRVCGMCLYICPYGR